MPASRRSRVDLPAPLWPTRPTRSPCLSDSVMSCSASMIGTRPSEPILPPTLPSASFFSDLDFASKIGKSTDAFQTLMLTMVCRPPLDPVRDAGAPVAQRDERESPAEDRETADDRPVVPVDDVAEQRRPDRLEVVVHRVQLGDQHAPAAVAAADLVEHTGVPHDRRH